MLTGEERIGKDVGGSRGEKIYGATPEFASGGNP
jgi:hypothetical protein